MSITFLQDVVSTVAAPVLTGVNMAGSALKRLQTSGLIPRSGSLLNGGLNSARVQYIDGLNSSSPSWKVRITLSPTSTVLYQSDTGGILAPLKDTGVIFPYTPQIQITHQANYTPQRLTHSNYAHFAYEQSEVQNINITSDFTAQNAEEARYVLACIYFFRAATKMFFGRGELAGNPPPIVFLEGYGDHYLPRVPCVITNFTHNMPNDVDYVEVLIGSSKETGETYTIKQGDDEIQINQQQHNYSSTRIPVISSLQIGLQPVYSKQSLTEFDLNKFSQGELLDKRFI
jgi:hypothetical protein